MNIPWLELHILTTFIIWLVGVRLCREDILKPHTGTGSALFLIGLFWFPTALVVILSVAIIALGKIFTYLLETELWR